MVSEHSNFEPDHDLNNKDKPNLDEIVYNWIKLGYNSIEEIVKLKNDFELDIQDVVKTLKRLQKYELIKITKNEVMLNGVYDL
jgi:hypothetical protein